MSDPHPIPSAEASPRPVPGAHTGDTGAGGLVAWFRRRWRRLDQRPLTVGVDLQLMQPGGANGGVKPLVFSFLREIQWARRGDFRFVFFAAAALEPELRALTGPADQTVEDGAAEFDVLYAPFGRSRLMRAERPTVSLIVDLLHRDLPEALPIEEVNYRHEWFGEIAARAAAFQCISRYTAERLQAHYGIEAGRCFVTHLPVHERLEKAPTIDWRPTAREFFFYPANFWPHKNHEALLTAYRDYRAGESAPWDLVLTGHPDARTPVLRALAARLGLDEQVHFLGHLADDRFGALWRSSGALVYPSLHEGFGIPLLEAMAFGCPSIVSNTTSLPEVGGDACYYVDPRNASALSEAMRQISRDSALRRDLARRGRRRLRAFSLSREAGKLADAWERVAGRG